MCNREESLRELNRQIKPWGILNRWYDPDSSTDKRSTFEHDCSVIIYSNAFKRMSNKSQIIVKPIRDHFRSRMVHAFEVQEIALAIGRELGLNPQLIAAIALGHDLGHTPFGHAGERALQRIVRREANTALGQSIRDTEESICFNHASNSARVLAFSVDRSTDELDISIETIRGAFEHSWNPWCGRAYKSKSARSDKQVPTTYEGQAVAIADQLAGINHDIEDILAAEKYIGYSVPDFRGALRSLAKRRISRRDGQRAAEDFIDRAVVADSRRGFGRKFRIERTLREFTTFALDFLGRERPDSSMAAIKPLPFPDLHGEILDIFEWRIRQMLREETWFIGRDTMAEAIVTTVFNHFWPTVRNWPLSAELSPRDRPSIGSLFPDDSRDVKVGRREESPYLAHYAHFVDENYVGTKEQPFDIDEEVAKTLSLGIETWVSFLYQRCADTAQSPKAFEKQKPRLVHLIALVDFISGMTDRYCLEIFQETYGDFMLQG